MTAFTGAGLRPYGAQNKATLPPAPPSPKTNLMSLPEEIRMEILHHVFEDVDFINFVPSNCHAAWLLHARAHDKADRQQRHESHKAVLKQPKITSGLLLTNYSMFLSCMSYFAHTCKFLFHDRTQLLDFRYWGLNHTQKFMLRRACYVSLRLPFEYFGEARSISPFSLGSPESALEKSIQFLGAWKKLRNTHPPPSEQGRALDRRYEIDFQNFPFAIFDAIGWHRFKSLIVGLMLALVDMEFEGTGKSMVCVNMPDEYWRVSEHYKSTGEIVLDPRYWQSAAWNCCPKLDVFTAHQYFSYKIEEMLFCAENSGSEARLDRMRRQQREWFPFYREYTRQGYEWIHTDFDMQRKYIIAINPTPKTSEHTQDRLFSGRPENIG